MDRKIKVAQYGVGRMGSMHIKYAMMKGCEIVAAIDANPNSVGRDVGEIVGIEPLGIKVTPPENAETVLKETQPDICIVATRSFLADCRDAIAQCVTCGCNVITICEEALWPFVTASEVTKELDELAKAHGVTVCGTGFADVFWGNLPAMMFGASAKIDRIHGSCIVNLEDYGDVLAERHGVGLTMDQFHERFGSGKSTEKGTPLKDTCFLGDQNGWICRYLGLTIKSQKLEDIPITSNVDVVSNTMKMTIPAGNVIGASTVATTETEEGIAVEFEIGGKVYEQGDIDSTQWTVTGDPSTKIVIDRPPTPQLTCTISINRIPDVINAEPGYVSTERLPFNRYLPKPLNEYVL